MENKTTNTKNLLNSLTSNQKEAVLRILKEFSDKGQSNTYNNILYNDYKEIPPTIDEFLDNDLYLGKGLKTPDEKGKVQTVFPYWREVFRKLFPNNLDTTFNTLILTGGIGLGKSFVAVICMLYLLCRMLCLKDPYKHYGLQPIDKITFSLLNITLDAAKDVAWNKLQQLTQSSTWFMSHGNLNKSTANPEWSPKGNIELICGSQPRHILGRAVFCLDGDTRIVTTYGSKKLKDLVDKKIQVISIDESGKEVISDVCTVKPTLQTNEEYQIELEDGTTIKCTSNHKLMLKDGTYKEAQYLTENDELMNINITYNEFIQSIINSRGQWNIPKGEYWEGHHIIPKCMGGEGETNQKHPNIIRLYAHEHFIAHKLLALEYPNNTKLVFAWSMMAFPKSKTQKRDSEIDAKEYEILRKMQSNILSNPNTNPGLKDGKPWNYGKTGIYNEDTLVKLKAPRPKMRGVKKSLETRKKMSIAVKNRYLEHPETFKSSIKDKMCITNGVVNKYIDKDELILEGFHKGSKSKGKKKDMSFLTDEVRKRMSKLVSGKNNPMYGHGDKLSGGKNGHAIYVYTFEGIDYQCRDDLMKVLKDRFPKISESAIRRIQRGNYSKRIVNKFKYVIDNLTWRLKKDEN